MPLNDGSKRLQMEEDLYLMWPYQWDAINEIWGAILELSAVSDGGPGPLEDTLKIIGHRFGDIMENLDERIPRSVVEEKKGGAA